ncbi:MAG: hypothetical protein ACXWX7_07145 [Candidatus Binatia bacterium]
MLFTPAESAGKKNNLIRHRAEANTGMRVRTGFTVWQLFAAWRVGCFAMDQENILDLLDGGGKNSDRKLAAQIAGRARVHLAVVKRDFRLGG